MTDRPTKRQQQAAATQDQLLQAAREVFQEKGMTVVTLSHPATAEAARQEGGSR